MLYDSLLVFLPLLVITKKHAICRMLCVVFYMFDCWPKHFFAEPRRSTCIAVVFAPRTQSSCVYVCAFDPMPFVDIMYNWHGVRAKWSFSSHFTPRALPSYALLFSHVPLNFSASASPWLWHANGLRVVCPGHKLFRWSHFCSLHTLQPPPLPPFGMPFGCLSICVFAFINEFSSHMRGGECVHRFSNHCVCIVVRFAVALPVLAGLLCTYTSAASFLRECQTFSRKSFQVDRTPNRRWRSKTPGP